MTHQHLASAPVIHLATNPPRSAREGWMPAETLCGTDGEGLMTSDDHHTVSCPDCMRLREANA